MLHKVLLVILLLLTSACVTPRHVDRHDFGAAKFSSCKPVYPRTQCIVVCYVDGASKNQQGGASSPFAGYYSIKVAQGDTLLAQDDDGNSGWLCKNSTLGIVQVGPPRE